MLAAWALAAASVQLVQRSRRPGVLDAIHATQDACARAARGKKAAERTQQKNYVSNSLSYSVLVSYSL